MVKTADVATENYRRGIEGIGGASKYYECGAKADVGPAIEVAKCLEAARKAKTTEDFVSAWRRRMYGS